MINNTNLLIILTVGCLFLTAVSASALETDTVRVSGIVTDYAGDTLPGATVIVKGTNMGKVTDINGKYSLTVPENAILQFSFLGYAMQEIVVGTQRVIDIKLAEEKMALSEMLTTGIEPAKSINLTVRQKEKVEVDNIFAFKMFREVSKQEGANTFFSPFSLNMALGMLYNGSSGNTRAEMNKALGITDFSETEINEYYQTISQTLLEIDPITNIGIANSIWYRDKFTIKGPFIETCKEYFDAEVMPLNFTNPDAANMINKWCAEKTNNRINHIVSNPIPDDMMLFLINALYFKSKWQKDKRFDKEKTKLEDFTKNGRQTIKANMMEQTTSLPYYSDQYLQCVELPYGNQAFSTIAILPSENLNIERLIEHLPTVRWQNIVINMQQQRVWLKLPRFKIECEFLLNQPVMNLGMNQIFRGGFANIADVPLQVSNIKQKTFVEVNEEGAEAAAVTANIMMGFMDLSKTPVEPVRFFANRPFLFLIREKSTGVILFIGRIDEPRE